jgi:hypothetical protein
VRGDGALGPESAAAPGPRRTWTRSRIAAVAAVLLAGILAAGWFLRDPDPRVVLCRPAGSSAGVQGTHVILSMSMYERVPSGRPRFLPAWCPWPEPDLPERRFLVLVADREGAVDYPRLLGPAPMMGSAQEVDRGPAPGPLLTREEAHAWIQAFFQSGEIRFRHSERRHAVIEGR